jgi:hypothetical protein
VQTFIRGVAKAVADELEASGYLDSCAIVAISSEVSSVSPPCDQRIIQQGRQDVVAVDPALRWGPPSLRLPASSSPRCLVSLGQAIFGLSAALARR